MKPRAPYFAGYSFRLFIGCFVERHQLPTGNGPIPPRRRTRSVLLDSALHEHIRFVFLTTDDSLSLPPDHCTTTILIYATSIMPSELPSMRGLLRIYATSSRDTEFIKAHLLASLGLYPRFYPGLIEAHLPTLLTAPQILPHNHDCDDRLRGATFDDPQTGIHSRQVAAVEPG